MTSGGVARISGIVTKALSSLRPAKEINFPTVLPGPGIFDAVDQLVAVIQLERV